MKQNNNNLLFYVLGIIILGGIFFVATKEIVPEKTHVEIQLPLKK